jgi:DNA polymerase-3 subunit chi
MNITFYILEDVDLLRAQSYLCNKIETIYARDKNIYIHTSSLDEAKLLDDALWTYRADSFIPHHIRAVDESTSSPIEIGFNPMPDNHSQFSDIIEIVAPDATKQAEARERYKQYRQKGFSITTHKLKASDL